MKRILFLLGIISIHASCCGQINSDQKDLLGHGYEFEGNGKDNSSIFQESTYYLWAEKNELDRVLELDQKNVSRMLKIQEDYLKGRNNRYTFKDLSFSDSLLRNTIESIKRYIQAADTLQIQNLNLYRLSGEDGKGNVHFTGYFTPVLEARKNPDSIYKYPLYRTPEKWQNPRPTRDMIDRQNVLVGQGLEIAWTSSLLQNYFMHVQGSGYLRFEDGSLSLLLFDGQNGHAYTSIGKYMVKRGFIDPSEISLFAITQWFGLNSDSLESILNRNKSYTFFRIEEGKPRGAAGTDLVPGHSIAVDPSHIPMGSILMAKTPVLNTEGNLIKHEFRLLTAQDRGGAIKGSGHVDLYMGIGDEAEAKAGFLHHYGSLWLILTK